VQIVNIESLSLPRTVYRDARAEKEARAAEYSTVKRLLSKDDVVIADGLNYIKGLRYQLYCEAKAMLTPSCVVCPYMGRGMGADGLRGPRRSAGGFM
jgi:protein KTI12